MKNIYSSIAVVGLILFLLSSVEAKERTALEEKQKNIEEVATLPFTIALYRPTYFLPLWYVTAPDTAVYESWSQPIEHTEAKAQISLRMPITQHFNVAYTQLSFWQVYAHSKYFRETDYEPELFFDYAFNSYWWVRLGLDHQSNGMGNQFERSWNRAVATLQFSQKNWIASLRAWAIIFPQYSSSLYNPDIGHYLGYENVLLSYRLGEAVFSLQVQNIESGLKRGFVEGSVSYPLVNRLLIYGQVFSGYGQSLIEYNHRTQSAGIGIAFNNWI